MKGTNEFEKICVGKHIKATNGITLLSLIITIVIMLILVTVTVNVVIDGGLFENASDAVNKTEIASEKEAVQKAIILAKSSSKTGRVTLDEMQKALNNVTNAGSATAIDGGETIIVKFGKSNRYYELENSGNIQGPKEVVKDEYPGDITKGGKLDGSAERPYEINCIEDLVALSIMSNGGNVELGLSSNKFTDKYVKLMRTLDFNSIFSYYNYETTKYGDLNTDGTLENIKIELTKKVEGCVGFTPITNFGGYFDGQGNEIQNIYIKREGNTALLLSAKNINNVGVTGEIISTTGYAGGICTGGGVVIEHCWNKASVTSGAYGAAGICGSMNATIKNCYNEGNITNTATLNGMAGGILLVGSGDIENCYNTGNIKGSGYVGGIASGHSNGATSVKNCYNTGNVTSSQSAGGILGVNGSTIENCYNTGNIEATEYAGGIVGSSAIEIKNCYNTGAVKGNYIGGICYKVTKEATNCYNLGDITGVRVGGIVGINETSGVIISNCFNAGNILRGNVFGFRGGILGSNTKDITINNSYSIGDLLQPVTPTLTLGGIVGSNTGTDITINKCYYLKTEKATQAISGVEDSTLDVVQCTSVKQITADILNANRSTIEHDEEWREWIQGEKYPVFR